MGRETCCPGEARDFSGDYPGEYWVNDPEHSRIALETRICSGRWCSGIRLFVLLICLDEYYQVVDWPCQRQASRPVPPFLCNAEVFVGYIDSARMVFSGNSIS